MGNGPDAPVVDPRRDGGPGGGADANLGTTQNGQTAVTKTYSSGGTQATITWYGGCWFHGTIYGITGDFQSFDFQLTTNQPLPIEGTLFFTRNCDPSGGTDNMNDYGTPTGSGHSIQGFTHHPDVVPSSAVYWLGDRTADGMCPGGNGGACSGCINYDATSPSCDVMP